jgi:hypothetical protein
MQHRKMKLIKTMLDDGSTEIRQKQKRELLI